MEAQMATAGARASRVNHVGTLTAVFVPPLGLLSATGLLWGVAVRPLDLVLLVVFYVLGALGLTVGFHRLFAHHSFEAAVPVRAALAIFGSMAMQGPLTPWVTNHRKHHAHADREGDPHSPHGSGGLRGLFHAHLGWLLSPKGLERGHAWGRDLYEDRLIRAVDRLYVAWVALTLGIPFAIGYAWGGPERGLEAVVWGGLIRVFLFQHVTFSVASVGHMFGPRPYRTRDESRNNALLAFLMLGDGWHNNHHAFPSSAKQGLDRGQLDAGWLFIRGLERLGLVWNVRQPDAAKLAARRA